MNYKKYIIAIIVIALFYLGVSYLMSLFFGREYDFGTRLLMGFGFGILITLFQVFLGKKKKRRP